MNTDPRARGRRQFRFPRPETARPILPVLEWIIRYKEEHDGNSPTVRAIGAGTGIPSTSQVLRILQRLEEAGHIRRISYKWHGKLHIAVRGGRWLWLAGARHTDERSSMGR